MYSSTLIISEYLFRLLFTKFNAIYTLIIQTAIWSASCSISRAYIISMWRWVFSLNFNFSQGSTPENKWLIIIVNSSYWYHLKFYTDNKNVFNSISLCEVIYEMFHILNCETFEIRNLFMQLRLISEVWKTMKL